LATVPLGIARAAIDDLLELAGRKAPSYLATPLKDRSNIQALIGEAEATLGAGRAYLYEALREVWDKALQGYVIDMPGKMKLQLAATYAAAAADDQIVGSSSGMHGGGGTGQGNPRRLAWNSTSDDRQRQPATHHGLAVTNPRITA
jgi:alkylation response protein AidB-like acyl-CoA dehydrogenase